MSDIRRLQIAVWRDTVLPRDALVMTPHFKSNTAANIINDQSLCDDLATAIQTWTGNTGQIRVSSYDAADPAPNPPKATKLLNSGQVIASTIIREVAVCLSFFAGENRPRRRGRLYVPMPLLSGGTGVALRPPIDIRTKVAALVPIFSGLGGADIDWVVFSRADQEGHKVTDYWVDDEWDIVRSRGLKPTSRNAGTTSG